jgi:tetratricopeptide (TPR) repeat protein
VRAGNKFYNSEKYIEAEVEYRKGLQKNPSSFEANYNLGNSLFRQNKYKEALEQYKTAAALHPDDKAKIAAKINFFIIISSVVYVYIISQFPTKVNYFIFSSSLINKSSLTLKTKKN